LYQRLAQAGEIVAADGSQDPKGFHMVVVDGASTRPAEMSKIVPQLSAALDSNVPVMFLEPTEEHKKSLSSKVHGWSSGASAACFIYPIQDQHGRRFYGVHEQFAPRRPDVPLMVVESHRGPNGKRVASEPVEIASSAGGPPPALAAEHVAEFVGDVTKVLRELRQKGTVDVISTPPQDCPFWANPYKIYQPIAVGATGVGSGSQTVSGTAQVGIYYDNLTYSNPVQWTLVSNQGNYSSDIIENDSSGLGWTVGGFEINGPGLGASTQGDFSLFQSSPQSVSGQTNYSSTTSFTVGVAAGTDGLSANASYTESSNFNFALNDWEITLTGDDSWNFYQQVPYSGEWQGPSFPSGAVSGGSPAALPSISTSSLSFATQTVWLVMNPLQSTMPITFNYQCFPTYLTTPSGKNATDTFYYYSAWTFSATYNLDFGPANPTST
jgi:hypothetical protein